MSYVRSGFAGLIAGLAFLCLGGVLYSAEDGVDSLLLKDYRPESVYNIPQTRIERASYPVIDMHSHDYAKTAKRVDDWVKINSDS